MCDCIFFQFFYIDDVVKIQQNMGYLYDEKLQLKIVFIMYGLFILWYSKMFFQQKYFIVFFVLYFCCLIVVLSVVEKFLNIVFILIDDQDVVFEGFVSYV